MSGGSFFCVLLPPGNQSQIQRGQINSLCQREKEIRMGGQAKITMPRNQPGTQADDSGWFIRKRKVILPFDTVSQGPEQLYIASLQCGKRQIMTETNLDEQTWCQTSKTLESKTVGDF